MRRVQPNYIQNRNIPSFAHDEPLIFIDLNIFQLATYRTFQSTSEHTATPLWVRCIHWTLKHGDLLLDVGFRSGVLLTMAVMNKEAADLQVVGLLFQAKDVQARMPKWKEESDRKGIQAYAMDRRNLGWASESLCRLQKIADALPRLLRCPKCLPEANVLPAFYSGRLSCCYNNVLWERELY